MTSRHLGRAAALALLGCLAWPVQAALTVFACEPEWADLTRSLLPEATITTATTAWQDPHYIEARPSLIAAMGRADLAVCTGASLEAGWLPSLLNKAANPKVRTGQPGLFYAADQVPLHQPHHHVDRSLGDVHPEGDPHVHLDPDRLPLIAEALAQRLVSLAPRQARDIRRRLLQWRVRWNLSRAQWREAARTLAGTTLVVQHSNFGYLLRWLGVNEGIDLEPKPGLPPSAAHLNRVLREPRLSEARGILIGAYQDRRPAQWLADRSGLSVIQLPGTVTDETPHDHLAGLIGQIISSLQGLREAGGATPAPEGVTGD